MTTGWSTRCADLRCPHGRAQPEPARVAYCAPSTCRALDLPLDGLLE